MGFLNPGYDDDYRIQSMPGTTDIPAAGALDGSLTAIPKGVAGAVSKVYGLETDLADSSAGRYLSVLPGFSQLRDMSAEDRKKHDAQAKVAADWAATGQDPRVTGSVGRIASNISEGLTIGGLGAPMGPWGAAALLGATEGDASYKDARAQGLNQGTAEDQAAVTALFSAAGALVPMKFGSTALTSILGGSASNVALGAAQREMTSAVLESHGYTEQAKQYRIFDGEALAADAILGSAFGYMGHRMHAESAAKVNPADVDAALAVSAEDHFNRSGPGIPTDPATATAHADTMADAIHALANGDLPNIPEERAQQLVDNVVPDPAHEQATPLHEAAVEDLPGYADAVHEVPRQELPPEQPAPPRTEPEPKPAGEPAQPVDVPLDPYHADQLDHLVHNYGDLPITTDDGRELTYRQMADEMQRQRNEADKFAKLHDVAAACGSRNGA